MAKQEPQPTRDIHTLFGVQTSDDLVELIQRDAANRPVTELRAYPLYTDQRPPREYLGKGYAPK